MVRKFITAKNRCLSFVFLWGDGSPTREFLYVEDAAEGIAMATEKYDSSDPVNLGNGHEISIRVLAEKIKNLCEYEGQIIWDTTELNGQPRRCLDTTRAEKSFGFVAPTSLEEGLKRTTDWYENHLS
jgi:GDP-L-fucose synthase